MKTDKNRIWPDDNKTIGNRIRKLRQKHGMTQEQLGKELMISGKTIGRIERGYKNLYADDAVAIANHFNISCDELLRGQKPDYYKIEAATGLKQKAVNYLSYNLKEHNYIIEILNIIFGNSKIAHVLFNSLYVYALTLITDIEIKRSSFITDLSTGNDAIKKKTIWNTVENYLFLVCEKLRIEHSEKLSILMEGEMRKLLEEMKKDKNILQEEIDDYEKMYNGDDFDPSEGDGRQVYGV